LIWTFGKYRGPDEACMAHTSTTLGADVDAVEVVRVARLAVQVNRDFPLFCLMEGRACTKPEMVMGVNIS
jgi:hypothetical protein